MTINILGDGVWGKALSTLLIQNNHKVEFWDKKNKIKSLDVILIAVPTTAIREVFTKYGKDLKTSIIINSAKGIEKESHKLPNQIIKEILGKNIKYFTIMGPSFAEEVEERMPTIVNLAGCIDSSREIADLFETDYFRVKRTNSLEAIELSGALKNVYAISCGIAKGLGFKTNTQAKLITIAFEEIKRLCKALNYEIDHKANPAMIGDLILTCTSEQSRNFSFGMNLVKYNSNIALKKVNSTVEGYSTAFSIPFFTKKTKLPLAEFIFNILEKNKQKEVRKDFASFAKNI